MRLEVKNLSFSYKSREVLKDVSFSLEEGQSVSLIGRNGSGKSTIIKIILGFLEKDGGNLTLEGKEISDIKRKERAAKIAYIPQFSYISYPYTVKEVVLMGRTSKMGLSYRPKKKDLQDTLETLSSLSLYSLKDRSVLTLSGGEWQLVLVARALMQGAKILLLDEPTSALDYSNSLAVNEKLLSLSSSGYSVLITTHNPSDALFYSDKIVALKDGFTSSHLPSDIGEEVLSEIYGRKIIIREIDTGKNRRLICVPE